MNIAVVSDTHRSKYYMKKLLSLIEDTEIMLHLGDNVDDIEFLKTGYKGNIIAVRGNCDFSGSFPVERLEVIGGKRIFMTHGHKYDVKYDLLKLKYRAMEVEADIVLFGHTHMSMCINDNGIWFINPGSPALARDSKNSIAILEIGENKVDVSLRTIQ
jgi:putative phosphoesterase